MNATIIKTPKDFFVLNNTDIVNKFFIYDFENCEYRTEADGITPIAFDSRYEANSHIDSECGYCEIIKPYSQLPLYLKEILR